MIDRLLHHAEGLTLFEVPTAPAANSAPRTTTTSPEPGTGGSSPIRLIMRGPVLTRRRHGHPKGKRRNPRSGWRRFARRCPSRRHPRASASPPAVVALAEYLGTTALATIDRRRFMRGPTAKRLPPSLSFPADINRDNNAGAQWLSATTAAHTKGLVSGLQPSTKRTSHRRGHWFDPSIAHQQTAWSEPWNEAQTRPLLIFGKRLNAQLRDYGHGGPPLSRTARCRTASSTWMHRCTWCPEITSWLADAVADGTPPFRPHPRARKHRFRHVSRPLSP